MRHMIKRLLLCLLLYFIFASPVFAVRSLPAGVQPETKKGVAAGNFSFSGSFGGSSSLTFINTGGDAHLNTVCDTSTVDTAAGERCEGIDLDGTFTGGPYGTAIFKTESGAEITFQLEDGKVFSFAVQGISMKLMVTDPTIFDDWVESTGARDSGARVSDLSGQVEIACPPDLEAWDVMKMGRIIYVDCHLKTGEDSKAVISFSDWTTFEMKAESEIVIDSPPEKDSKLKLLAGNIWANVKKMVKDGTMEVHMSQAVAGIKGTRFMLTETGKESKIDVAEGIVVFTSTVNGQEAIVSAGESVTATEAGLSDKTAFDISSEEENRKEKSELIEKKSPEDNILSSKMIYLAGAGVVIVILLVIGTVVFKKRKHGN